MSNLGLRAMAIPEANRIGGCHKRVAKRGGLFLLPFNHHDEEDSAFVPATEPADSPITDTIAQRYRLAKAKELGLNVHGYLRPDTSIARLGRIVNSSFRESSFGHSRALDYRLPNPTLGTKTNRPLSVFR